MIVTINTDASFYEPLKIAAFAYWIKCDKGKLNKRGSFRDNVDNPQVAEFMAITNALHALSRKKWKDITLIIINTDCLNIIHYLNGDQHKIRRYKIDTNLLSPIKEVYTKYLKNYFNNIKVQFRHVKAHTKTDDPRSFVNNWCDQAAKLSLGEMIKNIRNEKETIDGIANDSKKELENEIPG